MYQIDFNKPIHIHFMGIGGISMSGLAEILIKEGFSISGSDIHTSDIIKHLEDKGAKVYLSQTADNITDDIDLVVYTAAINFDTNEEYKEAIRRNIPVMKRATLLGQMMHNYQNAIAVSELTVRQQQLLCYLIFYLLVTQILRSALVEFLMRSMGISVSDIPRHS